MSLLSAFRSSPKLQAMAENAAETLMIRYLPEFIKAISEPSSLACGLFARRIISRSVYNEAIGSKSGSKQDKSVSICDAVLQSVHVTPCHLIEFMEVARNYSPAMDNLCLEISRDPAYGKNVNSRKGFGYMNRGGRGLMWWLFMRKLAACCHHRLVVGGQGCLLSRAKQGSFKKWSFEPG